MDIIDYLITHISPLPWTVKGPGFALMAMLTFRAFGQFLTIRWIKAATNLELVAVVALVMARNGEDISEFIDQQMQEPPSEATQDNRS